MAHSEKEFKLLGEIKEIPNECTNLTKWSHPTWILPMTTIGKLIVHLPLFGLVFSYVTAVTFQFEKISTTQCGIRHQIPSLSAVTGLVPQRYVWQICISLHSAPKFGMALAYYKYYMGRVQHIATKDRGRFRALAKLTFWLSCLENFSLCCVNCIANVENYDLHERIFIVYMCASVFFMFFALLLFKWAHPQPMEKRVAFSYSLKKSVYLSNSSFTICLIYFHLRHRLYCQPGAFNLFSLCEYGIAFANMYFNQTAMYDFAGADFFVANTVLESPEETDQDLRQKSE